MAFTTKTSQKVAVKKEITEGVYVAPSIGSDFITALEDGLEVSGTKEVLERNILGTGLTKVQSRTANRAVAGTIPCEFKAGSAEGDEPEYGVIMEAAMGEKKTMTGAVTSKTGHTSTEIEIEDADIGEFAVDDIIVVKEAGAYHISPIVAVDTTGGAASITMLVAMGSSPADNVEIAKATTFRTADSGHPTFSVTKYIEDAIETQGTGCRVSSMSMDNFTANQIAAWSFGFTGLDFQTSVNAIGVTPAYDTSLPPIIVNACVFKAGINLDVSEMSFSVENTIGVITSTCAASGKISSRVSERTVSGSMTPYIEDDNVTIQDEFSNDTLYSIFGYAYNPTGTAGEFNQIVAFYLPNCNTTELSESDNDGIMTHSVGFSASGGSDGTGTQIIISFI